MICHWEHKILECQEQGKHIHLQGVKAEKDSLPALSPEQFVKWYKGNDIWALAVVQQQELQVAVSPPPPISHVLEEFQDVFKAPATLPPH
jgi:hypothetical protein